MPEDDVFNSERHCGDRVPVVARVPAPKATFAFSSSLARANRPGDEIRSNRVFGDWNPGRPLKTARPPVQDPRQENKKAEIVGLFCAGTVSVVLESDFRSVNVPTKVSLNGESASSEATPAGIEIGPLPVSATDA